MKPGSQFLPESFDVTQPVAVVAGQRDYPVRMVEAMRKAGLPVRLIALSGETDGRLADSFSPADSVTIKVGQVGKLLQAMQKMAVAYAVFVGQVTPGKLFRGLHPDLKALTLLASLKERNAHTIFGTIAREIEKIGVTMLDARAFMDDHLASEGLMTSGRLRADPAQLDFGVRIAREIARLDIGQGVVVRKGTVLAVEAFEGTDDMLSRANKYKTDQLIFVKTTRPDQNHYFDWPVFGVETVANMHRSGVTTAALEVEKVVMLDRPAVIQAAEQAGIELWGFR